MCIYMYVKKKLHAKKAESHKTDTLDLSFFCFVFKQMFIWNYSITIEMNVNK